MKVKARLSSTIKFSKNLNIGYFLIVHIKANLISLKRIINWLMFLTVMMLEI